MSTEFTPHIAPSDLYDVEQKLYEMFIWASTPEGVNFWGDVTTALRLRARELEQQRKDQ